MTCLKRSIWGYFGLALLAHIALAGLLYPYYPNTEQAGKPTVSVIHTYFFQQPSDNHALTGNQAQSQQAQANSHKQSPIALMGTHTAQPIFKSKQAQPNKQAASIYENTKGHSALLALLHNRIQEHQHYPQLALVNEESGSAIVRFHLHPNGDISDSTLERSSGHHDLDQAALLAVQQTSPLPASAHPENNWFNVKVVFLVNP